MRLQRRMKRSTKQYIMVALICIIVIGGAAAFTSIVITSQIREEYQVLLNTAYHDMKANQKKVYVAVTDISSGDVIKENMVEKKLVYSSQPKESYITVKEIGKIALVGIPAGTQILDSMITDNHVTDKLREMEYQVISMNSNITDKNTVDIRIFYPNGESYVVLSKKEIKSYIPETASVYLWLVEEELLRMSAAIVDAGLYSGSKLYVTKYIEPNIQEASIINYVPSLSILSLIENDPNIIERCSQVLNKEIRKALENRLATSMSSDVSAISWEVDPYDTFTPGISQAPDESEAGNSNEVSKNDAEENDAEENDVNTPSPSMVPQKDVDSNSKDDSSELGSESYFYYVEGDSGEGDIEYGE